MIGRKKFSRIALVCAGFAALATSTPAFTSTLFNTKIFSSAGLGKSSPAKARTASSQKASFGIGVSSAVSRNHSLVNEIAMPSNGLAGVPASAQVFFTGSSNIAQSISRLPTISRLPNANALPHAISLAGSSGLNFSVPGNGFGLQNMPVNPPGLSVASSNARTSVLAVAPAVPEPATWLMLLLGFGLSGFVIRHRKSNDQIAFA